MIKTENEYKRALKRLNEDKKFISQQKAHFTELGYGGEELERLMQPSESFYDQLNEEVVAYEKMKRGDLGNLYKLTHIGRWLIGLRIALGLSQKEMAELLGVSPAQVSRDETNDYHGITTERAQYILEKLGVTFEASINTPLTTH